PSPTPPRAPRTRPRSRRRRSAPASSSRTPAARRRSTSGRGPPRSRAAAPTPGRGCAPAPRSRPGSAGAAAARAAPARPPVGPPRPRRGRPRAKYAPAVAAANLRDETVEKMSAPFALRVHGRSGHASMPGIAGNALVKAARLVGRLAAFRPEPQFGPEAEAFLRSVLGEVPPAAAAVERTRA